MILHFIAVGEFRLSEMCPSKRCKLRVVSTYRDNERQAQLYAQGRTTPGAIVTNAKAGQSWHNYRCAADIVPEFDGVISWDHNWFETLGPIAEECGLTWGGRWHIVDLDHFQYTGGLTLADLQAGKKIEAVA